MLKPSDTWIWYMDEDENSLMLDLGDEMVFKTNLSRKLLVECAMGQNNFTVDDASAFQIYKDQIANLDLSEPRQAELALYCVAAKRFHKPVQPKSWFFDHQNASFQPEEGELVRLTNQYSSGFFIVLEVGESASLCALVDLDSFNLTSSKDVQFGQSIKVMHDRMDSAHSYMTSLQPIALVG
ncbi:cell division protein ZapC [Vibrio methylphosphonaticus]|uniref:cell division protein ZapC n=1 Tax=Vibrio methylphosphonaticus TaxID=2946866 RepID=UPI00202A6A0F|nr:cell division protein ZapC [Vibrio methylphosphonaticus]MCL9776736.1 cell division protein ZapC [Vibrio methylphosphonaticus]